MPVNHFWKATVEGDSDNHPQLLIASTSPLPELPAKVVRVMSVTEKCSDNMMKIGREGLVIADSTTWRNFNHIVVSALEPTVPGDKAQILGERAS